MKMRTSLLSWTGKNYPEPEAPSHLTILRPREASFGGSSRITTDFITSMVNIDRDRWSNRREFFFTTLSFCLSLANIWRFPREALIHGQGTFVVLYIMFIVLIGNSLLFFEIALGQYSCKGFTTVFAMCPIFEGISYSMAFYCLIVSTFYNMLNVFSFKYFFASFLHTVRYASCPPNVECVNNSAAINQSDTTEQLFFEHTVLGMHDNYRTNMASIGVLFFLWVLICIAIVRGIRRLRWPAKVLCPIPYIALLIPLSLSLMINGSKTGITAFFSPNIQEMMDASTWKFAFEQTLVTLGLGMGPLITLGSYSKFQSPAHLDCLVLCACSIATSLLSGMLLFSTAGILAHERGQSIETVFKINGEYKDRYVQVQVILSQLFTRLPYGVSQFASSLYYFMMLSVGWYSLITYTETFTAALYSIKNFSMKYKIHVNIVICALCFLMGCTMAQPQGYKAMHAIDRYMIGISLVIIMLFELIGVIYVYGIFELCDDIEFMLGFYPNTYYQIMWICSPVILLVTLVFIIIRVNAEEQNFYDDASLFAVGLLIVGPIVIRAIHNAYKFQQHGNISKVCYPREVILYDSDDVMDMRSVPGPSTAIHSNPVNPVHRSTVHRSLPTPAT